MGGRVVAAERDADAQQGDHDDRIGRAELSSVDEEDEQQHLDDEQLLAAVTIGPRLRDREGDHRPHPCGRLIAHLVGASGRSLRPQAVVHHRDAAVRPLHHAADVSPSYAVVVVALLGVGIALGCDYPTPI